MANSREQRVEVLGNIGPNWFASVMGTGVIALAASILPVEIPGLFVLATVAYTILAPFLKSLLKLLSGLAAYAGNHRLPPPKAPGLGGPVVILGLLLLVGLSRGGLTVASSEESRPECTSDKQCPAGQYCLRGSCVSNAHKGKSGKQKVAASGPLGMEYEVRDPERPAVDWVQRNL